MHAEYRKQISSQFTPRAVRKKHDQIDRIAREILDDIATDGAVAEIDFVEAVSARLPVAVIADMLGVPREDWKLLFEWTNEIVGADDPEYRREGETPLETSTRARHAAFEYFWTIAKTGAESPAKTS